MAANVLATHNANDYSEREEEENDDDDDGKSSTARAAPLSPKMPSKADERRLLRRVKVTRHHASPSKANALMNQQSLSMIREQYRKQAKQNESAYEETINRLINSMLYEILLLGGPRVHANNPIFMRLCKMCIKPAFRESADHRRKTWLFIENNIEELLANAAIMSAKLHERSDSVDLSDDDSDDNHLQENVFVHHHSEQLALDIYDSCLYKMRQVYNTIRERNLQRTKASLAEKQICLDMFRNFQTNCSLQDAGRVVVDGGGVGTFPEGDECSICINVYNSERPAVLLRCCQFKTALCTHCLLKTAFASSNMGCQSFFKCAFCKGEITLYDHLDRAPPPPPPAAPSPTLPAAAPAVQSSTSVQQFAQSIGDTVKQKKRKSSAARESLPQSPPPSPPRVSRSRKIPRHED